MVEAKLEGKVLITGASGFIGGRLRDALVESGAEVVTLRRPESPTPTSARSVAVSYARIDDLERVLASESPRYLFHVAGVTKGRSYRDFWSGNVLPTRNLLDAIHRVRPPLERFVLVSSSGVYGPSTRANPHRESNLPSPIEYYGKSKLEAERAVEGSEVPWTILRPSAVYGPGDADFFNLFQSAKLGVNAFFGNRGRCMSMVYVDDCVRGILKAALHAKTVGNGYFLATDESITWERFQSEIVRAVGGEICTFDLPEQLITLGAIGGEIASRLDKKPRLLNLQKAKMGAQEAWTCSAAAAKADFGFVGEVELPDGVRRTHQWYQDQGWYRRPAFNPCSLRGFFSRRRRLGR